MLGPSSRPDIASPLTGSIWPYRRRLCSRNTVLRSSQGRWFIFDVDVSPRRSTSVLGACGLSALHAPSRYPVLKVPAAAPVAPVPCGKGIYCQTPAAAGAGIGASTMCTQLGSFERSVQLYVVVSERSTTKVDRLPTLTRLCSVAPLFRESPSCQFAPCIKKLVALLNGWSLRVHTHHRLGSRRAHKHPRLIGKL